MHSTNYRVLTVFLRFYQLIILFHIVLAAIVDSKASRNYGRKVSWIANRYGNYGRKVGWIVKMIWKNMEERQVEKIWKMWRKGKLNSEKIWKMQKKSRLNCEKIWKLWKKGQLNSEMIWKIWKISVLSHNYTQRDLLLHTSHHPPLSIHVYTLFFRIEKNHPGIVCCLWPKGVVL